MLLAIGWRNFADVTVIGGKPSLTSARGSLSSLFPDALGKCILYIMN